MLRGWRLFLLFNITQACAYMRETAQQNTVQQFDFYQYTYNFILSTQASNTAAIINLIVAIII